MSDDLYNPEEDGIIICTECSTPLHDPTNNMWVQQGMMPPCPACGGVMIYSDSVENAHEARRQHNVVERNLDL